MKYTLLDIVQTVLEAMDGDEVNGIDDTAESAQVATCARSAYNRIVERANLPEDFSLFSLTATTDDTQPVKMTRPDHIRSIKFVKYNTATLDDPRANWQMLRFVPIDTYLATQHALDTDEDTVATMTLTIGTSQVSVPYRTDVAPKYYTTYDDHTILFDAIDLEVDDTLQESKTLCYGEVSRAFSRGNGFIPSFDDQLHTLWLEETLVLAFNQIKQIDHADARMWAKRFWIKTQADKQGIKSNYFDALPNYGRRR